MSNLKQQIDSFPNFASLFSVMNGNSSVLFQLKKYILCSKCVKMKIFETFEGSKFVKFLMSIMKPQVNSYSIFHHSSVPLHINPLYVFSSCIFYDKRSHQNPNLTLSSALVKICQIPHVFSQTTSHFFFKFFITLQCHVS